ncbi:hypothetical protein MSC49_33830 [Methylosinus sp. C49]|uniref:hypothetical protein n=1 Tax=Methylosinus sp. C49 TaxID=2699395 RepID=UPI001366D0AC|nr:hypothetical protein [Methylosinus sp. C49]BBU63448.1 hypothetical protein MSC49_33830 [Methylosinus sp. C49]
MTRDLQTLIEAAKKAAPSPQHREEQRRSFVYGNTAFENSLITREMVDKQAAHVEREPNERRK